MDLPDAHPANVPGQLSPSEQPLPKPFRSQKKARTILAGLTTGTADRGNMTADRGNTPCCLRRPPTEARRHRQPDTPLMPHIERSAFDDDDDLPDAPLEEEHRAWPAQAAPDDDSSSSGSSPQDQPGRHHLTKKK